MRRIGNRLQLAIKRWTRQGRKLELFRFRQRWAKKFNEYECVGGPLDGHVRTCHPRAVVSGPTIGGHYEIDLADCRLHFHVRSRVSPSGYEWNWDGGI